MRRDPPESSGAHVCNRLVDRQVGRIRLRGRRQVGGGLGERNAALRHPDECDGIGRGHGDDQSLRVGEADVFGRGDDEPTGDEPGVFAGLDHPREVVHRGIDVRAADGLDERADDVVVLVALPVVPEQRAIHRTRDVVRRDLECRVVVRVVLGAVVFDILRDRLGEGCRGLQRGQCPSRITRGQPDERVARIRSEDHAAPETTWVGDRAIDQHPEVVIGERLQREQQGSRQQGRDDGEGGVLGGRGDEHDPAVLDAGQQRILLRLRETVDLVEEQNRRLPVEVALSECLLHDLAHIAHPRGHGGELDESPAGGARDRLGQCRLAGSGRTPQDHGCRGPCRHVRSGEQHERRARTQQMGLSGDLLERRRPHPHGERSLPLEQCGGGHGSRLTAASDPRCGQWRAGLAAISPRRMINPARRDRRAREVPWRRVESSAGRARSASAHGCTRLGAHSIRDSHGVARATTSSRASAAAS